MSRESVRADLIAGVTIAMVLIPQSMAYAQLAGMPPVYGLYAAFLPGIVAVIWGSSHHLATGPVAMTSLLTAAALTPFAEPGSDRFISLAIFLALLVGVVRLLMGIFRLGFLVNFLSQPVVRGFTNAGALIIASSQLSKMLKIPMGRSGWYIRDIGQVFARIGETHLPTLCIGLSAVALLVLSKKYCPKLPGALVAAGLTSLVVFFFRLGDSVAIVGAVPAGLPKLEMPVLDIALLPQLLPAAVLVMFIGLMEVTSVTKAIATKSRQKIDLNQELIGQGMSAIVGSFSQCYPTSGSFSRSALNYSAGGRTGLSSVFAGVVVLVTLLFLTPLLHYLPYAALSAIIMTAVVGLIDFPAMKHAWKVHPHDGFACFVTFGATLVFAPNMVNGILVGGAIAIFLYLYRTMSPRICIVGRHSDGTLRDSELHKLEVDASCPAIRYDGSLVFANVGHFEDSVLTVLSDYPEARSILVLGDGINEIDASGENMLQELVQRLKESGVNLVFVGLKYQVMTVLERTHLASQIGAENIFRTEEQARQSIARR